MKCTEIYNVCLKRFELRWWCNGLHAHSECCRSRVQALDHSQTKDYEISICYFSDKHISLRSKSKNWFAQNQESVSEWTNMSILDCYFSEL